MNILRKHILLGVTALSMGVAAAGAQAQAQAPEGHAGHGATMEQHRARMAENLAKRQAKLHDALKLNSSQEPAWTAFVNATKPEPMADREDRAQWKTLSAPARMEKMIALSKERTARMESHLAALNTFYAVLTPEQKKIFDEHTMQAMSGMHGWHHMHGMKQG
jgi:Spy/CpxP family protein refolding chaperone